MTNESIYDEERLATPDEVVNFGRGDGLEKALVMADVLKSRGAGKITINIEAGKEAVLTVDGKDYSFKGCRNPDIDSFEIE